MLILNQQIVKRINLSGYFIVHCDDATLQRAAELQVRLPIAKQQKVCRITANVNKKKAHSLYNFCAVWDHSGICLRKNKYAVN